MQNLHLKLTSKYPQYNNWHQTKHHNKVHWGVLVVFTFLVFGMILRWTPISLAADTVPPTIPTNLTVTAVSSTQINLSWTASTDDVGVAGYNIYRCAGSACAPTVQIATSPTTSYSDTGLTASTAYTYAVSAYDAAGNESGKSAGVSATTQSSTAQTWQRTLTQNFNIAESFDDVQDWQGKTRGGKNNPDDISDLPRRLDGSLTSFNAYTNYKNGLPSADYWIKDHRENGGYIWDPKSTGNGKSLVMDLSKRCAEGLGDGKCWGPDRFGLYFGDGMRTSGYSEMYTFFMLWMPKEQWPTSRDDGTNIGSYIEGQPYKGNMGMKFMDFGHGFIAPWKHADTAVYDGAHPTYGWHPDNTKLYPHNNQPELVEEYLDYHNNPSDGSPPRSPCENEHRDKKNYYTNVKIPTDQWIGIEVRHKLNDPGQDNGIVEMWYYDSDGTPHQVSRRTNLWLQASCLAGDKYNWFHIGGNNSNNWLWGPGMEPRYYMDDFIVDNQRIGPKYFPLLSGTPPPPDIITPSTPTNLTTPISSSQINLSWTVSTDNVAVTGYKVYRCAGTGCTPTAQIATSATNSYSTTGLTASTVYTYAVSAYDAAGNESGKSSSVLATTLSQFKPSDLNQDQKVNQLDFDILKQDWNRTDKPVSDLNQDGIVDSRDLGIMMSEWTR